MRIHSLLAVPLATALLLTTACGSYFDSPEDTTAGAKSPVALSADAACEGRTDCTPVGNADVDGDGRLDAVGQVVAGDDRVVVVHLAGGATGSLEVDGDLLPAQSTLVDEPLEAYRLGIGSAAQIVVPVSSGSTSMHFAVLAWRDGELSRLQPPGSLLRPSDGGFSLWSFRAGEGERSRVLCTADGIAVGEAKTPYGGETAGPSTRTAYKYQRSTSGTGHGTDYTMTSQPENVSPESITSPPGTEFFACTSMLEKDAKSPQRSTASPAPTATTAACESQDSGNDAPKVDAAVAKTPAPENLSWLDQREGNYDPCLDLSYVVVNSGMTVSSAGAVLLFHKGDFVGPSTPCFGPLGQVNGDGTRVTVPYRWLVDDESFADMKGRATVTYRWENGRVVPDGSLPPERAASLKC